MFIIFSPLIFFLVIQLDNLFIVFTLSIQTDKHEQTVQIQNQVSQNVYIVTHQAVC